MLLVKGQNTALTGSRFSVTVDVAAAVDVSALLVTASGRVRSDADFVFYNQPAGPGVTLSGGRLDVDLAAVPIDVDQIRAVISLDGTGQRFGSVAPPVARVHDAAGADVAEYPIAGLGEESIVIALEFYRRADAWKLRAVGQGYAGGLASLITDHGVSVTPAAAPPPPAYQPPPAPPTYQAPPAYQPPPAPPAYQPPPAPPAYQQPPAYPPSVPQGPAEVGLSRSHPVSLAKGQRVSLAKEDGQPLGLVRMGLGWDAIRRRSMFGARDTEIDLDASVFLLADSTIVDVVFYNNLRSRDGSILHTGDNRTGEGDGDDESVIVDLTRIPAHVTTVLFVVTSYEGQTFEQVANAFCRLVEESTRAELARYTLTGGLACTGMVMAKVYRDAGRWKLQAIGEGIMARTPQDVVPQLNRFL